MNQEQLMKFTLRQMEMETKSTLKSKRSIPNYICDFCKTIAIGRKSKNMIKGGIDHD